MFLDSLYFLFIYPIKLILECIFSILYTSVFKGNVAIALAGLSLAVSFFCLPMYAKAEQLQQIERDIRKRLAPKIASIKKHFIGDERYYLLSAYYRQNNYHPLYSLRSSLSLLIQIPFFIAAYSFLVNLDLLEGKSFLFLNNFSKPDEFFSVFGININVLPIIMTIINLLSAYIYSNNLMLKEKFQLYITPLIFLFLLYNSPSALVLYWTMNNIFSLFKNLFLKFNNPLKILYFVIGSCFVLFAVYIFFIRYNSPDRAFRNKTIAAILLLAFISIPLIIKGLRYCINYYNFDFNNNNCITRIFLISIISIWLLVGLFIPSNIISSDPAQFSSVKNIENLLKLLYYPLIQGAGIFILWPFLLFSIFSEYIKTIISIIFTAISLFFFSNYFIFQPDYGIISQTLNFSLISGQYLSKGIIYQIINILSFIPLLLLVILFFKYNKRIFIYRFIFILSIGLIAYSSSKVFLIKKYSDIAYENNQESINPISQIFDNVDIDNTIKVSKNGKNVFIIMLDGAINSFFPLILEERPELLNEYSGFTYYPNTISFYRRTMFGAPPIFGGYEYSSYNMNKHRNNISIKEKQLESITLLPLIFKNAGFHSIVTDIPDNGFFNNSAKEYYSSYEIEHRDISENYISKYMYEVLNGNEFKSVAKVDELLMRNLLMLSLVLTVPYSFRDFLYINGRYWSTSNYYLDSAISSTCLGGYTSLFYYPDITKLSDDYNYFYMITNNITHDHVFLQYPDYTLESEITEYGHNFFNNNESFKAYHVNSAAYILLANWFKNLRECGVWDNTRIIIVSDHGDSGIENPNFSSFNNNYVVPYNPILLLKDFEQNDPLLINNEFMTNADVPFFALKGIDDNPVNPFTGNFLVKEKSNGIYIYTQGYTNASWYQGTTFLNDNSIFYHVHNDIFDSKNWTELKYRDFKDKQ